MELCNCAKTLSNQFVYKGIIAFIAIIVVTGLFIVMRWLSDQDKFTNIASSSYLSVSDTYKSNLQPNSLNNINRTYTIINDTNDTIILFPKSIFVLCDIGSK